MSVLEYRVSAFVLRILGFLFSRLPHHPERVVLASPRTAALDGNLLFLHRGIRTLRPDRKVVLLLEPYSYGFVGKLRYALRVARGMYLLRTSGLFVVDNAYLPVHVAPHPPRTTVVQVWHAAGALKRFGLDTASPPPEPERTFLHRYYDWVVTSGEASRGPWSRALRTPLERVLPLGTPRTDLFFDATALARTRAEVLERHPELRDRRVITYAPTFRGRGRGKRPGEGLDVARLRAALPQRDALVLKSHPNLDPALVGRAGFDVVVDPAADMNELLAATDVLITDYSSSIFEFALLGRPLILLVPDLADYARDPGLYVDYAVDMIGSQVRDTEGVIQAIASAAPGPSDPGAFAAFARRHLDAADGHASERFVDRFL